MALPDPPSTEQVRVEEHASDRKGSKVAPGDRDSSPERPPPLPPRPGTNISLLGSAVRARSSSRPPVRGNATTGLSLTDINTHVYQDGSRDIYATTAQRALPGRPYSTRTNEPGDATSIKSFRSYLPNITSTEDMGSLFGGIIGNATNRTGLLDVTFGGTLEEDDTEALEGEIPLDLAEEWTEVGELNEDGSNEEQLLETWKSKRKHFIILSAAGKPIYTRHGDTGLISGYVGVIQTILSFFQGSDDPLRTFTAGGSRFVVLSQNNLFLVAISRLQESESQLRAQLEALYMQILSTLTLPQLEHIFSIRPSSDLRRPLQGTEVLLSSLADSFTRGSPTTLLSALESLRLRKSHRQAINSVFLKCRADELLYGLLVAGGRLVSVVRPKKHSLHPSDLQLIFNMIFEADGIHSSGGESWIPVCLPGFNSSGYLHMYVNFVAIEDAQTASHNPSSRPSSSPVSTPTPSASSARSAKSTKSNPTHRFLRSNSSKTKESTVAIILISPHASSFPSLQNMSTTLLQTLRTQTISSVPLLTHITNSIATGRPSPTDIVPGTPLVHFLYKSRPHVQFVMPPFPDSCRNISLTPTLPPPTNESSRLAAVTAQRALMTTYAHLHSAIHTKNSHVKVQHSVNVKQGTALGWATPTFELYAIGSRGTSRAALARGANGVVRWAQGEEERLFLIGGAVF